MAKAEAKKGKKARKSEPKAKAVQKAGKPGKLPKRIAGVKVPKQLRETGEQLVAVMNHPIFADVVAASLVAAANALREDKGVKEAASAALGKAARTVSAQGNPIGAILTAAALDGVSRMAGGKRGKAGDEDEAGGGWPH